MSARRRRTIALALLVLAAASVTGSAAGQPIAITPRPSSPPVPEGFRTTVSDRGVVTVDRIVPGFVGLADGTASVVDHTASASGTDAAFVGTAVAVSGDATFSPQGPAGPVFGSQLIVNRR